MNRIIGTASLLATLVTAACVSDSDASDWTATVDTAGGVRRVINTPAADGAMPTVVMEEQLRVGTATDAGPESFGLIRSIAALPDGRFAVADAQAEEVRVFARDGAHLRTFGGKGGGPGELDGMQGVHADHEGLLRVAEQGNSRLSVFDPDSGFVTTHPLRLYSYSFRGPWRAAMDSTGRTYVASSGQYGQDRFWRMLRIYDAAMQQMDSIPYDEYTNDMNEDASGAWRIQLGERGFTWAPVPFYAGPREVLDRTGEFWSSAEGETELRVARWSPPADTTLVLISRRTPEPVSSAERDSAMNALRESLERRTGTAPGLDPSRVPATKPPAYDLSVDDRGRLWVRLTPPTADTTTYDVFERDGRHAGTVNAPFRIDGYIPPVIRGDTAWVVVLDEMDVQYVVRALLRPIEEVDAHVSETERGS